MRVFIDAQPLLGVRSGIGNYVRFLCNHLMMLDGIDLTLFFNRILKNIRSGELPFDSVGNSHFVYNSRYPYKVIRRLCKPNPLYAFPFDLLSKQKSLIFHGTNFTLTPSMNGKSVITIHDLAYMIYPETTSERIYRHHTRWVPYSAQKAERIIAISEHTKNDIIRLLNIPETKIDIIPLAADPSFRPLPADIVERTLRKLSLPQQYILFVGTLEPRKNLLGLFKTYELLLRNIDRPLKLVVVGAKGWKFSPLFDFIESRNLEQHVIFAGYIDDEDLPAVYNGASVYVMPSVYEGFGLPILEAMQCGIPVIGSNVSSIPEIIDRYGILVPPDDYEQWAERIHSLTSDEQLHRQYRQLSLERATHYSWEKTAIATKKVYEKVLFS